MSKPYETTKTKEELTDFIAGRFETAMTNGEVATYEEVQALIEAALSEAAPQTEHPLNRMG